MADRQISELVEATAIEDNDLLVLQQGETAKKAKGKTVKDWVYNESVENFVIISDTEPTTERNHIWVDPSEEDVVIPTMDDLQGLTAEDISYDGSATHTSGSVGEAISELSSDIDGLDAGDVEYDSSTTYGSGSVGAALATQSEKIDELKTIIGNTYEYPHEKHQGYINSSSLWAITGSNTRHIVIPVVAGDSVDIYAGSTDSANIGFLRSYAPVNGAAADLSTESGYNTTKAIPRNNNAQYTVPSDAIWLYIYTGNNSPDYDSRMPISVFINDYNAISPITENIGDVAKTVNRIAPIADSFESAIGTDGQAW